MPKPLILPELEFAQRASGIILTSNSDLKSMDYEGPVAKHVWISSGYYRKTLCQISRISSTPMSGLGIVIGFWILSLETSRVYRRSNNTLVDGLLTRCECVKVRSVH